MVWSWSGPWFFSRPRTGPSNTILRKVLFIRNFCHLGWMFTPSCLSWYIGPLNRAILTCRAWYLCTNTVHVRLYLFVHPGAFAITSTTMTTSDLTIFISLYGTAGMNLACVQVGEAAGWNLIYICCDSQGTLVHRNQSVSISPRGMTIFLFEESLA